MPIKKSPIACVYLISTHLGGGERSIFTLLEAMQSRRGMSFEPWVIVPKADGPLIELLKQNHISYDVLKMPGIVLGVSRLHPWVGFFRILIGLPALLLYGLRLLFLIRRKQPQLIYSSALKCHLISAVIGRILSVPVFWHLRDIVHQGGTLKVLRFFSRRLGPILLANSHATADGFLRGAGITVIYNGIDPKRYRSNPNRDLNREAGWPASRLIIGIVGAVARWKGQLEFVQMAAKLIRGCSGDFGFVIIGDEIYDTTGDRGFLKVLKEEVSRLGISDRVYFAGFKNDPAHAMNSLDLLVHASIRPEPFGRVVIEAMACGVPVVASAAGGILEILQPQVNKQSMCAEQVGLTFTPGNVDEMAAQVEKLVKDPTLRKKLTEAASAAFQARFTDQSYVAGVNRLFEAQAKKR